MEGEEIMQGFIKAFSKNCWAGVDADSILFTHGVGVGLWYIAFSNLIL